MSTILILNMKVKKILKFYRFCLRLSTRHVLIGCLAAMCGFLLVFVAFNPRFYVSAFVQKPILTLETQGALLDKFYVGEPLTTEFVSDLTHDISQADTQIDVLMFSLNEANVVYALRQAAKRGVNVRVFVDMSKKQAVSKLFEGSLVNLNFPNENSNFADRFYYMHHKMVVIDNATVYLGSNNLTNLQIDIDNGYMWRSKNTELIALFAPEIASLADGVSGFDKISLTYNPYLGELVADDYFFRVWRTPGVSNFNTREQVIELIKNSEASIDLMMWYFSDAKIFRALQMAALRGVNVRLLWDAKAAGYDESFLNLVRSFADVNKNFDLRLIKNENIGQFETFFHFHTMQVDSKELVFGTNNWSNNGFFFNDEMTMFTNHKDLNTQMQHVLEKYL